MCNFVFFSLQNIKVYEQHVFREQQWRCFHLHFLNLEWVFFNRQGGVFFNISIKCIIWIKSISIQIRLRGFTFFSTGLGQETDSTCRKIKLFFTYKGIKISDISITNMCNYVTFFIVFLTRFIVVFSDSSSMSILGGSGSFGPIRGSLLLSGSADKCSTSSSILRFRFSSCVVRGTNLTAADCSEFTFCLVLLSLSEEGWLKPELGCGFVSVTAVYNVPILSSFGMPLFG